MIGKKILLTGGTGYIGQTLVKKLIDNQCVVSIVVRDMVNAKEIFPPQVSCIEYTVEPIFKAQIHQFCPEIVIHLASYSSSNDDLQAINELIESNIVFVSHLLDALRTTELELFVNAGSFSEYFYNDNEISPAYFYSATKTSSRYIIDYFSQAYGFKFVNAILYTVYGKKSKKKKVIDYLFESLNAKVPVKMTAGEQILDFIHIDDVSDFFIHLLKNAHLLESHYSEYSVGTGRGYSIRELAKFIEDHTHLKANIEWGAFNYRQRDTMQAVADTIRTKERLNWQSSIPLIDGLQHYVDAILLKDDADE